MGGAGTTKWARSLSLRAIAGIGVAIVVVTAGLAIFGTLIERRAAEGRAAIAGHNVARLIEANLTGLLDHVELSLQVMADAYGQQVASGRVDAARVDAVLDELFHATPELGDLRIIDAEGIVRFGHDVRRRGITNVADREYFRQLRDHADAGVRITPPRVGTLSGQWTILLTRRINAPDGSFAGIAAAALTIDSFRKIAPGVDLGAHGLLSIRSTDYGLVYRYPTPPDFGRMIGSTEISAELRDRIAAASEESDFVATASDGVERFVTVRKAGTHPFYVIAGEAREDYLDGWWRNTAVRGGFALMVALLTALGIEEIARNVRRMRDAEARLNFALEGTAQGVWDWDIPAGTTYFSSQWKRMLGYGDDELSHSYQAWHERIHPEDRAAAEAAMERHLRGETATLDAEYRMRHKDGHWIWTEARGKVIERADDGLPKRMIGTLADITARKRREDLLTTDRDWVVMAQRAAGACAWDWDMAAGRLRWADAMYGLLGLGPATAQPSIEAWRSVLHPEDLTGAEQRIIDAIRERKPLFNRYRIIRPDGEVRWIEDHADTEYDEAGMPKRMSGISIDVTDEQELTV